MWGGLPVPRVEHLGGRDYHISLDRDKFINIIDSSAVNNYISIINPLSRTCIGTTPLPMDTKLITLSESKLWPQYFDPANSILNEIGISDISISNPSIESTSVLASSLPGYQKPSPISIGKRRELPFDTFEDVPLGPVVLDKNNLSRIIDPDATPRANPSRLPQDTFEPVGSDWDPFT